EQAATAPIVQPRKQHRTGHQAKQPASDARDVHPGVAGPIEKERRVPQCPAEREQKGGSQCGMPRLQSGKSETSPAHLFSVAERGEVVGEECDGRKLRELSCSAEPHEREVFPTQERCPGHRERKKNTRSQTRDRHPPDPAPPE